MKHPPYENFPILSDSNILLRQIRPSDVEDLLPISYYDAVPATTVEEAAAMQEQINRDYEAGSTIHWGIEDRSTHRIVGTCGYYRGFEGGSGELGCVLLPLYRGRGFMTRAMRLAIDFGFQTMGLNCIAAITSKQNTPAINLIERLGFTTVQDADDDQVEYLLPRGV